MKNAVLYQIFIKLVDIEKVVFKLFPSSISILVLFTLFALIISVRWDYHDPEIFRNIVEKPQIDNPSFDIYNYAKLVSHFRGEDYEGGIIKPFRYRLFHPYIASFLPFTALKSLQIINVIFHALACVFIYLVLNELRFNKYERYLGVFLYIFSYPMMMYGSVGWNEPVSIAFIIIGIYFVLTRKLLLVSILLILGSLNNEKVILLLIFSLIYEYIYGKKHHIIFYSALYILTQIFIRIIESFGLYNSMLNYDYVLDHSWMPSISWIIYNLIERWQNYPSIILTFGFVGFGSILFFKHYKLIHNRKFLPFIYGYYSAILMYLFSISVAVSSGRLLWYIYPFAIVLTVQAYHQKKELYSETLKIT